MHDMFSFSVCLQTSIVLEYISISISIRIIHPHVYGALQWGLSSATFPNSLITAFFFVRSPGTGTATSLFFGSLQAMVVLQCTSPLLVRGSRERQKTPGNANFQWAELFITFHPTVHVKFLEAKRTKAESNFDFGRDAILQ